MTDKIPSFKEEIDAIHVPTDKLDAIIMQTVQGRTPRKKRSLRKKVVYSATAAVAALSLLIGSATISPVMANIVSQIPIIGSIFNDSGDRGLKQVGEMGLTQAVGQSKILGNMTITIDEVYYDGTRFTMGYSFESETPLPPFGDELPLPRLSMKGEPIGSGRTIDHNDVSPTVQTNLLNINAPDLPKEFDLDVTFQQEDGEKVDFTIPMHTQTDTKLVVIDNNQEVGSFKLEVSNLKISPAGVLLSHKESYPESKKNRLLANNIYYKVVDESGNEYFMKSGDRFGEEIDGQMQWTGSQLHEPIDEHVKELTIIPHLDLPDREIDENGKEQPIDYTEYNLEDIQFESITVKLP